VIERVSGEYDKLVTVENTKLGFFPGLAKSRYLHGP
jgi:hypothetical protein